MRNSSSSRRARCHVNPSVNRAFHQATNESKRISIIGINICEQAPARIGRTKRPERENGQEIERQLLNFTNDIPRFLSCLFLHNKAKGIKTNNSDHIFEHTFWIGNFVGPAYFRLFDHDEVKRTKHTKDETVMRRLNIEARCTVTLNKTCVRCGNRINEAELCIGNLLICNSAISAHQRNRADIIRTECCDLRASEYISVSTYLRQALGRQVSNTKKTADQKRRKMSTIQI